MLKLAIIGYDPAAHENSLASVTLECCRKHFEVSDRVAPDTDVAWFCYDTPIGDGDVPDAEWVLGRLLLTLPAVAERTLVLISSQIPVGSTSRLESVYPNVAFAHSPENIRVAHGVADFENQARVVVGRRSHNHDTVLHELFEPFTRHLILTDPETAECVKHFLNVWLAMTICFANEMKKFCDAVGADANVVSQALLTERRVSPHAPLKPGAPYGGGHLAREIHNVTRIAKEKGLVLPIISHIKESNES